MAACKMHFSGGLGKKAEKCNFEEYDTGIFTFKNEILLILLHFVEFL